MINLVPFKQGDPKWSQTVMKPGTLNLGQAGCLVTSCAMALSNYMIKNENGEPINPGELCEKMNNKGGFDTGSFMVLDTPARLWPSISLVGRYFTSLYQQGNVAKVEISEAVKRIKRLIQLGIPVAVNVDTTPKDPVKNPTHWVILFDLVGTNDFQMIDPIDGKSMKLSSRYDFADKAIFGYTAWIGPAVSFPNTDNGGMPNEGVTAWKLSQVIKGISKDLYTREAFESLINP